MIIIPDRQNKQVLQTNRSKFLGNLWATWNIDLKSDNGMIKVFPRMKLAEGSGTEANMGLPVAFRKFDNRIHIIAGDRVFHGATADLINTAYTEDASSGFKTDYSSSYSDMEIFNQKLYTTTTDELMRKAEDGSGTGAWTEIDSAFASETTPHPLCYFKRHDRLYYVDSDFIASIDTAESISSGSYEIDLNISWRETITCMKASANSIFIGTITPSTASDPGDLKGAVYEWDGISSTITRRYILDSEGAVAMAVKDDIPYIMDTRGRLLEYRGNGFQEIGRLPFSNTLYKNNSTIANTRYIHPNGLIVTQDGTILALVNSILGDNSGSMLENMPAGIWEWSTQNGFIHKGSISYTSVSTISDFGQEKLSAVGALLELNDYNTSASRNGRYLCGATYYTDASNTANGVFYDDSNNTLQKYGYFVTSWLLSSQLQDVWQKIAARYRRLLDSGDRIVVKYRTKEEAPIYIDITWENTTRFSTSTDLTNYTGYEVEFLQGPGSGQTAHISTVTGSSPWKANLDETITGVTTETGKARLQRWTKHFVVSDQTSESTMKTIPNSFAERIQIKCCMKFTGEGEFFELIAINKGHKELQ